MSRASKSTEPKRRKRLVRDFGLALLIGLIPLVLLIVIGEGTLLTIAMMRPLIAADGFFEQQRILTITVTIGLTLTTFTYAFACRHILRWIHSWHQANHRTSVVGGFWALVITSLTVVFPVILSFLIR